MTLHSASIFATDKGIPTLQVTPSERREEQPELTEEELILASAVLYGFSLTDKLWCEFISLVDVIRAELKV